MRAVHAASRQGMWRALRHRDFALFAIFGWFSTIGLWVQRIGLQWLTWDLTHSFAWLGAVSIVEAIAVSIVMPFGGSLADRADRLFMARITQVGSMVIAALMALFTFEHLMRIPALLSLVALNGFVSGFWTPTRLALIPNMVPREDLPGAIGLGSVFFNLAQFIGPAIAGILIASMGVGATFAVNSASYVAILIVLFMISLRPSVRAAPTERKGLIGEFIDAVGDILKSPGLGAMVLLSAAVSFFLRPYRELLAGYADGIFHQGPQGLSALASASGIAAAAAAFTIANFASVKGLTRVILAAALVSVAVLAVYATTSNFSVAIAAAAVMSSFMSIVGISSQILVQHAVPDQIRGRVMTVWGLQVRGLMPLGAWVMGMAAGVVGFHATLLAAAGFFLLFWAYLLRRRRDMQSLEGAPMDYEAQPAE